MRVLILGGTSEANLLAAAVARAGLDAIYSYAGRTQVPVNQPLPTRIGGFGGADGLADAIRQQGITHVVDATHPFAAEISRNAVAACAATATPLIALEREPWTQDAWRQLDRGTDVAAAVAALAASSARMFSSPSAASTSRHSAPGRSTPTRCDSSMPPEGRCRCPMRI